MKRKMKWVMMLFMAAVLGVAAGCASGGQGESGAGEGEAAAESEVPGAEPYRAIAYVTVPAIKNWRWIGDPGTGDEDAVSGLDTRYVTHINFAFGMFQTYQTEGDVPGQPLMEGGIVSKEAYKDRSDGRYHYKATVNGWIGEAQSVVEGGKYLRALVKLKEQKPELKVLLSIGGWDSDGFCYMARSEEGRSEFIQSCVELIREYDLDGIDLDWEYPTNGGWGEIASCDNCIPDAEKLIKEFRGTFDREFPEGHKLLTIASGSSQPWVGEKTFVDLDYINVMCYDYNPGTGGDMAGLAAAGTYMESHAGMVGDTPENRKKINLGIPFYNEGGPFLVPYYQGWDGHVDASREITAEKMNWVKDNGYGGAFYWAYSMDTFEEDVEDPSDPEVKILQRTVYETLNGAVSGSRK